jgi:hypothetical protein
VIGGPGRPPVTIGAGLTITIGLLLLGIGVYLAVFR